MREAADVDSLACIHGEVATRIDIVSGDDIDGCVDDDIARTGIAEREAADARLALAVVLVLLWLRRHIIQENTARAARQENIACGDEVLGDQILRRDDPDVAVGGSRLFEGEPAERGEVDVAAQCAHHAVDSQIGRHDDAAVGEEGGVASYVCAVNEDAVIGVHGQVCGRNSRVDLG